MILTNARILTFDGANRVHDSGSVEVRGDGSIGSVKNGRARGEGAVDLGGRLLMPALINCHSHLYSTLARGIRLPGPAPRNFPEILEKLWWRLDRALLEEDVYHSALIGLIDSARNGVGTVIDHHSSPNACEGSLDAVARAFRKVGLRGATCYETSDRNGRQGALAGIRENVRFIERTRKGGLVGAAFGLHASFTLSDRTLRECVEANQSLRAGFHVHVAEDRSDRGAARRLCDLGVLDERALAAHCIHVTAAEGTALARRGVNVIHNLQSNCNNAVGTAPLLDLFRRGVRVGLGSDGYSPRMWEEFKTAFHLQKVRARDPRVGYAEAYAAAFLNNREIVKRVWGWDIGRIETGAQADLLLVDYFPPTPIDGGNLFGHILFGIANAPVDSLMVDGRWVVREGRMANVDERRAARKAAACAKALWERF
ncbi:MAG TPA: putative aminohydrolase SsnA [Bryobacteraceae bacterium]|nr:putative aminohydrolase SsnA [Bryobacteraceae bacterium]